MSKTQRTWLLKNGFHSHCSLSPKGPACMGARKQDWGTGLRGWLWQLWHDLDQSRMASRLWLHLNHWNCKTGSGKPASGKAASFLLEARSSLVQFFNMVGGWLLLRPPPRERFRTPRRLSRHPAPYRKFLSPLTFYNGLSDSLESQTKSSCAQTRRIIISRLPFVASKQNTISGPRRWEATRVADWGQNAQVHPANWLCTTVHACWVRSARYLSP